MTENNEKTKTNDTKVHSEDYFGEYRDFWWNLDFLKLMGERLQLAQVRTALDVGCGRGHWGQLLTSVLPTDTHLVGIDREAVSITKAAERAQQKGLASRCLYQQGDVTAMEFPDNTFDMVTCQTVLIHLSDPKAGLREMLRVLKPGGLLLVTEPNNFANRTIASSLTETLTIEEVLDRLKFDLTIQRGKKALGLGFNSEGDLIPGYLAQLGADAIKVYNSDKALPFFYPYASDEAKANIRQMKDWVEKKFLGWDREEMKAYFLAGGGTSNEFERYWFQGLADAERDVKAIEAGTYHSAGGGVMYLISARKPQI